MARHRRKSSPFLLIILCILGGGAAVWFFKAKISHVLHIKPTPAEQKNVVDHVTGNN